MQSIEEYARQLFVLNRLCGPCIGEAIGALDAPPGSLGLDVGCGIGSQVRALAEHVAPGGRVIGLDRRREMIGAAVEGLRRQGAPGRATFAVGSLLDLPFRDGAFDWAWCKDTLWPGPAEAGFIGNDPRPGLRELVRVVRPGGTVALLYWTSESLLCGHPTLEARMKAAFAEAMPYLSDVEPRRQVMRAREWMGEAGLTRLRARTFVQEMAGPLDVEEKVGLEVALDMLWGGLEDRVSREDWRMFRRLSTRDSEEFLGRLPYHGFVTYSLYQGRVP